MPRLLADLHQAFTENSMHAKGWTFPGMWAPGALTERDMSTPNLQLPTPKDSWPIV